MAVPLLLHRTLRWRAFVPGMFFAVCLLLLGVYVSLAWGMLRGKGP